MTTTPSCKTRRIHGSISFSAIWPVLASVVCVWAQLWLPSVLSWTTKPTNPLPPPLLLKSIPLPVKLAGGLFLFGATAFQEKKDKILRREILELAEAILRSDPLISMELGPGIEAGGIFASSSSVHKAVVATDTTGNGVLPTITPTAALDPITSTESTTPEQQPTSKTKTIQVRQMSMEFQLNGGNSWAQARVVGIEYGSTTEEQEDPPIVQLISLGVANMDASLNGGWAEVVLPQLQARSILKYIE